MKLSLITIFILASVWTGSAFAGGDYDGYNIPCSEGGGGNCYCDSAGDGCEQSNWDDALGTFICGEIKTENRCTCVDATHGAITFTCGCYKDSDCAESSGYGCINNRCQECVSTKGTSYGAWTADSGIGFEKRTVTTTSCSGSKTTHFEYQCAAGYYGNTSGTLRADCNQCPNWKEIYTSPDLTGVPRGTNSAGTTTITGCYIAPGTYYDDTGRFKINSNCSYTN